MPELCRFFGIIIRMYYNDHDPPHFHAVYGEDEVLIEIDTLALVRGELPRRALALVIEWAVLHRDEEALAELKRAIMTSAGSIGCNAPYHVTWNASGNGSGSRLAASNTPIPWPSSAAFCNMATASFGVK